MSVFSRSPPKTLVIIGRPGHLHSFSHSTLLSLKPFKSFLYIKTMAGFRATLKRTLYPHVNILPNKSMVNLQDVDQMQETGKTTTYRSQWMGLLKHPNRLNPILISTKWQIKVMGRPGILQTTFLHVRNVNVFKLLPGRGTYSLTSNNPSYETLVPGMVLGALWIRCPVFVLSLPRSGSPGQETDGEHLNQLHQWPISSV